MPLLFFGLAALLLAGVFYNPRFALYLLPFELAAAGASLAWLRNRTRLAAAVPMIAAALLAASAAACVRDVVVSLGQAPYETRWAGETLRAFHAPDARVMARKPHVAYYSGMSFVPLPGGRSVIDLGTRAWQQGVRFILYSTIEKRMRPEYAVLADSNLALPGFEQLAWRRSGTRFYALYRMNEAVEDSAALAAALRNALVGDGEREGASPEDRFFVACQLVGLQAFSSADSLLKQLQHEGARDPAVSSLRSTALLGLGALDSAYVECERAVAFGEPTAWHSARLGEIRARRHQWKEARRWYADAVAREPASLRYLEQLGLVCVEERDYAAAGSAFERCLRLEPRDPRLRRFAMGAWQFAGDSRRMQAVFSDGLRAGLSAAELLSEPTPRR